MCLTITSITLPFTACIDEQHLRMELSLMVVREVIAVLMVVRADGSPRKFSVVAAVVQG